MKFVENEEDKKAYKKFLEGHERCNFQQSLEWAEVKKPNWKPEVILAEDDNGKIYIYYASSDTRLHVAESTVSQLVDYCLHTPTDGFRSIESVKRIITMVNHNKQYLKQ